MAFSAGKRGGCPFFDWCGEHWVNPGIVRFVSHVFFYFSSALVWGSSVKHQPQKVGKEHVLSDEDVVQIVKK
jgi:hypothetical protein